jgi:hypothetical protein
LFADAFRNTTASR